MLLISATLAALAMPLAAEVRLTRSSDGSTVIYNIPGNSGSASRRGPDFQWLARQRDRTSSWDEVILRYSREFGVDPVLVKAVITVESDFNPGVVSHKGARGLMQLMPGTAKRFGVELIDDPEQNIRGGIAYLAQLHKLFGQDLTRVFAAYNAGENAVIRFGGIPPYAETQLYVAKAMTVYHGRPMGSGLPVTAADFGVTRLGGGFKAPEPDAGPSRGAGGVVLISKTAGGGTVTRK